MAAEKSSLLTTEDLEEYKIIEELWCFYISGFWAFSRDMGCAVVLSPRSRPSVSFKLPQSHAPKPLSTTNMAAFIKAVNAKIRSNPVTDYICSTRTSLLISS